jgi:hypothetical protein
MAALPSEAEVAVAAAARCHLMKPRSLLVRDAGYLLRKRYLLLILVLLFCNILLLPTKSPDSF